jgi:hypothetical protein
MFVLLAIYYAKVSKTTAFIIFILMLTAFFSVKQIVEFIIKFLMPVVLQSVPVLELVYPKRGAVLDLLCKDHSLDEEKIQKAVDRLEKAYDRIIKKPKINVKQSRLL